MPPLILKSLEIHDFRGFHDLYISSLGRVNLIVGKNNIGKSSVLEAVYLYASRALPTALWDILEIRDEIAVAPRRNAAQLEAAASSVQSLFHGYKNIRELFPPIRIGPLESPSQTLFITGGWYRKERDESPRGWVKIAPTALDSVTDASPRIEVTFGDSFEMTYGLDTLASVLSWHEDVRRLDAVFIPANGLTAQEVGILWDEISLTDFEEDVLNSLRILAPRLERLTFKEQPTRRRRNPFARLKGVSEPIPLSSMGAGMNRILGISASLANARDGFLLIDEFENGLHYSVQADIWKVIFETAERLNVQVFASTHSWDCIEAFQSAAVHNTKTQGFLIRLEEGDNGITSTLFNEKELTIATKHDIEVR